MFETRLKVFDSGEYRVRVTDPIDGKNVETHFQVKRLSVERQKAVRNVAIQDAVAAETGGRSYEIDTIAEFLRDFDPPRNVETTIETFPIWSTWIVFGLLVALLLLEWAVRKAVNLS